MTDDKRRKNVLGRYACDGNYEIVSVAEIVGLFSNYSANYGAAFFDWANNDRRGLPSSGISTVL